MTSIRSISRRVALLQEQEKSLLSFWDRVGEEIERGERDRAAPDYLETALIQHSDAEAEYLISYTNILIDLLQTMIEDPDHSARLETARKQFFIVMAEYSQEKHRMPLAVHWHNILAWVLASALPDDMLSPDIIPTGRWSEPVDEFLARRDAIDAAYDAGLRKDRYDYEVGG